MPMPEREIFVNKGRGRYEPVRPKGIIVDLVDCTTTSVVVDNLFYLFPERQLAGAPTITGYQEWVENGWKEEHGTFKAASRFVRKLGEEIDELDYADYLFVQGGCELGSEQADELLSELGDVLWCATAVASNSTADIDIAMKLKLVHQVMGTGIRKGLDTVKPCWHDAVALVGTKWEDVELSDISGVIASGFEPIASTAIDIADDEPEHDIRGHIGEIGDAALAIWSQVRNQYCDGDEDEMKNKFYNYQHYTGLIAEFTANVYLNVAYIAYHRLGVGIEDVVTKNMAKINARIEAGRVDKADGVRSADLL